VAAAAVLALSATLLSLAAAPAGARTDNRKKPVLFLHGLFRGDMVAPKKSVDCWSRFDRMIPALRERGYYGRFDMLKYYAYDFHCGYLLYGQKKILGCGEADPNCDDPESPSETNIGIWGKGGKGGENLHYASADGHCPIDGDPCPPDGDGTPYPHGGHNSDATLQHIGYHLAWYIYTRYSSKGKPVDVAASSMSGMSVQYAVAQTELHNPDFPPYLKVEDVVLFANPHGGAIRQQVECPYVQCRQMGWPNNTPGYETATETYMLQWLANRNEPAVWEPDGKGGTDWTDFGSDADTFVLPWNAVGTDQLHTTKTTFGGCHKVWWEIKEDPDPQKEIRLDHGDYIKDARKAVDAPVWKEPSGTCSGNLVHKDAYSHPVREVARALHTAAH
jgi:hypothetical protein